MQIEYSAKNKKRKAFFKLREQIMDSVFPLPASLFMRWFGVR
jgi:hypothetical protein